MFQRTIDDRSKYRGPQIKMATQKKKQTNHSKRRRSIHLTRANRRQPEATRMRLAETDPGLIFFCFFFLLIFFGFFGFFFLFYSNGRRFEVSRAGRRSQLRGITRNHSTRKDTIQKSARKKNEQQFVITGPQQKETERKTRERRNPQWPTEAFQHRRIFFFVWNRIWFREIKMMIKPSFT